MWLLHFKVTVPVGYHHTRTYLSQNLTKDGG